VWADPDTRTGIARRMFAWRFGEVLPHDEPAVLRGIEGARIKESYRLLAQKHKVPWQGRRYDRADPGAADLPNQAINHAASCVEGAAMIAVAATATIPQLGFVHEDSAGAFVLDVADLVRTSVTVPVAFAAARAVMDDPARGLEREVRRRAADAFRKEKLVDGLIEKIKALFEAGEG
jgi:CRISP-associated protein Cas1